MTYKEFVNSKGDTTVPIVATLSDRYGVVDLTSCTVRIYALYEGTTTVKIAGASCTVTDATQGKISYKFSSGDVDTVGTFDVSFVVRNAAGDDSTFPTDTGNKQFMKLYIVRGGND